MLCGQATKTVKPQYLSCFRDIEFEMDFSSKMKIRRATYLDIPAIQQIQETYYVGNLPREDHIHGYLSARFNADQLLEMINDVGIFVAADVDDSVVGFLCAFQSNFDHQSPVIRKMIEKSQLAEYQGKLINTYRTFYYGPVCIDRSQRGRGLLQALYEILKREIASRFDFGIAFVAKNNVRSLRAHEEKLRMTRVGDFEVAGKSYDLLVFEVFP